MPQMLSKNDTLPVFISVVFGKTALVTTRDIRETFKGVFADSYLSVYLGNSEVHATHSHHYVKRSRWIGNDSCNKRVYKHTM